MGDEHGWHGAVQLVGSAGHKSATKKMKAGTYELTMWQHTNKPLVFAAWGDNSIVKTLLNCLGPLVLPTGEGVSRKRKGDNGKRERESTEVSCSAQMKYYCKTFHLIDKGNGGYGASQCRAKTRKT